MFRHHTVITLHQIIHMKIHFKIHLAIVRIILIGFYFYFTLICDFSNCLVIHVIKVLEIQLISKVNQVQINLIYYLVQCLHCQW